MASGRKPGPQGSYNDLADIYDGTMCLAQSSPPGPLGPTSCKRQRKGGQILSDAFARAVLLAPAAVHREIGNQLDDTLKVLVHNLIEALKILTASTRKGAMLSGYSVEQAEALVGGNRDILTSLRLEFLPQSIARGLGEMRCVLDMGISLIYSAAEQRIGDRDSEVEQIAEQLALAVGILSWAILHGIVAYLLDTGDTGRTPGDITFDPRVRAQETKVIAEQKLGQLIGQLRSSKLDNSFAAWVEHHWGDLIANPRLRPRPKIDLRSGAVPATDTVIATRASFPVSQPVSDPPTFSSDDNLSAQAATLIAAAAQGAAFCPV